MASSSRTPLCKVCEDPLVTQGDDGEGPIQDDLELPCGCHYHWQCLLDQASHIALTLTCPSCDKYLPSNEPGPSVTNPVFHTPQHQTTIRTRYASEDGVEENYDILPTLTEEAYLESHPGEQRPRAFHTMCGEGDVLGAVELLGDAAAEGEDVAAILTYRDSLARGRTALHFALEKGQEDAVWLLLFLGSPRLSLDSFPQEALDAARGMGLDRMPDRPGLEDVRAARDDDGRTPEDYARALPDQWGRLVNAGVLRP
jgi:hypothetical protein